MGRVEHRNRLRGLAAVVLAAVIGLAGCAGPDNGASPPGTPAATTSAAATTAAPPVSSGAGAVAGDPSSPTPTPGSSAPAAVTSAGPSTPAALTLPDALPVSLSVPAIGVTSPLSSLGRNPDGTVEVPSLDDPNAGAGWFRDSPEPGAIGPAIILGHVDSRQYGPGVFYDLKNLGTGDTIEITRADGTIAVFTVDSVQDVPKAQFPTQQVYGNLDHAGLRLITCGGVFDDQARSYEDNIIVFASLTSSRSA